MFVAQLELCPVYILEQVAIKRKAKGVELWAAGWWGKGGITVDKACSHVVCFECPRAAQCCQAPIRSPSRCCRLSGFGRRGDTPRKLDPKVPFDSTAITAPSRTASPSSSTRTSPWLWAESGPGPRRRGSRPDGSHPGAAACSNQGAPGVKKKKKENKMMKMKKP